MMYKYMTRCERSVYIWPHWGCVISDSHVCMASSTLTQLLPSCSLLALSLHQRGRMHGQWAYVS